jgi:Sec-independent protein secretion pathway component TatC
VLLGAMLNIVVRGVNDWKMPVFTFDNMVLMDKFHVVGNLSTTNLKWLSDWINVGASWIVSPGDILLTLGIPIYLIFTISIVVRKYQEAKRSYSELREG